jgi:hypothetical protein
MSSRSHIRLQAVQQRAFVWPHALELKENCHKTFNPLNLVKTLLNEDYSFKLNLSYSIIQQILNIFLKLKRHSNTPFLERYF